MYYSLLTQQQKADVSAEITNYRRMGKKQYDVDISIVEDKSEKYNFSYIAEEGTIGVFDLWGTHQLEEWLNTVGFHIVGDENDCPVLADTDSDTPLVCNPDTALAIIESICLAEVAIGEQNDGEE